MRVLRADPVLDVVSPAKKIQRISAYIDGASRGNPGPASVGAVFLDGDKKIIKSISKRIGNSTNNTAEYCALIIALQEAVMSGVRELEVFTDSELLARQWNGEYKIKEDSLKVLFLLAAHLKNAFKRLSLCHIPREQNKLADREANRALDRDFLV